METILTLAVFGAMMFAPLFAPLFWPLDRPSKQNQSPQHPPLRTATHPMDDAAPFATVAQSHEKLGAEPRAVEPQGHESGELVGAR
jgi:hypothetical protein